MTEWTPSDHQPAHPENADGPFYVENGCCITCGVPESEAPSVFGWSSDETQCVVKRQPSTPQEVTQTLTAMTAAEVDCIRYKGRDPDIARRMVEIEAGHQCDYAPPDDAKIVIRDRVTFQIKDGSKDPGKMAQDFEAHLREANKTRYLPYKIRPRWIAKAEVWYSWYEDRFHAVEFEYLENEQIFMAIMKPSFPGPLKAMS